MEALILLKADDTEAVVQVFPDGKDAWRCIGGPDPKKVADLDGKLVRREATVADLMPAHPGYEFKRTMVSVVAPICRVGA